MKAMYLLLALLLLGAQDPSDNGPSTQDPDAPHQRAEPPEYPSGVVCSPKGDVAYGVLSNDHACTCQAMCMHNQDPHGTPRTWVNEDQACLQWCRHDKCGCPKPDCCDETPK